MNIDFNKKTICNVELQNQRIIMRVDFNVPIIKDEILDDMRIRAVIPTMKYILNRGGSIVLLSHLGRPNKIENNFSIKPIVMKLKQLLSNRKIFTIDGCIGAKALKIAKNLNPGEIMVCENTRFYKQENMMIKCARDRIIQNNFAKELAKLGDIYVNDAFGTTHRNHASTPLVCRYIKHSVAGLLLENEIKNLHNIIINAERPFGVIIGGAKISDKIWTIQKILSKVDFIIVGGGLAYTFLKAQNYNIGKSVYDHALIELAKNIIDLAKQYNTQMIFPIDHIVAQNFNTNISATVLNDIPDNYIGLDIGPKTIELYCDVISKASTIIWNGPMGFYENHHFAHGTLQIGKFIANHSSVSVVSGGDSIAALRESNCINNIDYISTGGGSVLEFLAEDGILPGIVALEDHIQI